MKRSQMAAVHDLFIDMLTSPSTNAIIRLFGAPRIARVDRMWKLGRGSLKWAIEYEQRRESGGGADL